MTKSNLLPELYVGCKIKIFYNDNNINNMTYHVRAFVDNRIVVRFWSRYRQDWQYEVWHLNTYKIAYMPYITDISKSKAI